MISEKEIKIKSERKYKLFLQSIIEGIDVFPIIIFSNKRPSDTLSKYKTEFDNLISNSKNKKGFGYSIDFTKKKSKNLGIQSFPSKIYFETADDFARYLKKDKEITNFKILSKKIINEFPELKTWIIKFPLKVSDNLSIIDDLLKVSKYFKKHPQPKLYIRELPVKIHTKFIEQNKGLLKEILDIIIYNYVNFEESKFEKRFHLKYDESLVRFKILDQEIANVFFQGINDLSIPINQFKTLQLPISRIVIVENKTNLLTTALTLPNQKKTIVIFGKGFQVSNLKNIEWMKNIEILYWGDIDAQGFEILSQVRSYYPNTKSMLMDSETFNQFYENDKGSLSKVIIGLNLNNEENELYGELKNKNYRLEQEKIPFAYVKKIFDNIANA